jgi:hypothetical protein
VWLSVFVPFNEGHDPKKIAGRIRTSVDEKGTATATAGKLKITIGEDGVWSVAR